MRTTEIQVSGSNTDIPIHVEVFVGRVSFEVMLGHVLVYNFEGCFNYFLEELYIWFDNRKGIVGEESALVAGSAEDKFNIFPSNLTNKKG